MDFIRFFENQLIYFKNSRSKILFIYIGYFDKKVSNYNPTTDPTKSNLNVKNNKQILFQTYYQPYNIK